MSASLITHHSNLSRKLLAYCDERFPLVAYSILVACFFGSAQAVFWETQPDGFIWLGALVMWGVFFHLRIFDEHKDFHLDRFTHPERILSRGVVTLSLLGRVALLVILLQAALSALLGWTAWLCWFAALLFSLLMRVEFGLGRWLEQRLLLYAITHNPIVAALGVFAWGCSGAVWKWGFCWYLGAVSLGSFAFEIARKTKQPNEEVEEVESYSSVYGLQAALRILRVSFFLASVCAVQTILVFGEPERTFLSLALLCVAFVAGCALSQTSAASKRIELAGTIFLLVMMMAVGVGTW